MPYERCGAKPDLIAELLKAPTEVHIVASLAENRIKAVYLDQRGFIEGHVAAGNVLGLAVGEHHVGGAAWRNHNRGCDGRIIGRQEVWAADARDVAVEQIADEKIKPIFICPAVRIGESDDLSGRGGDTGV